MNILLKIQIVTVFKVEDNHFKNLNPYLNIIYNLVYKIFS